MRHSPTYEPTYLASRNSSSQAATSSLIGYPLTLTPRTHCTVLHEPYGVCLRRHPPLPSFLKLAPDPRSGETRRSRSLAAGNTFVLTRKPGGPGAPNRDAIRPWVIVAAVLPPQDIVRAIRCPAALELGGKNAPVPSWFADADRDGRRLLQQGRERARHGDVARARARANDKTGDLLRALRGAARRGTSYAV